MNTKKIGIILILILFGCKSTNDLSLKELINDVVKKYQSHNSISYSIEYKYKFFNNHDTSLIKANCKLFREKIDSNIKKFIWYHTNTGVEVCCDFDNSYFISHDKKRIYLYSGKNHQKRILNSTITEMLLYTYFFKPEKLFKYIRDTSNHYNLKSVKINNKEFWKLKIKFPDYQNFVESQKNIWIEKEKKIITKIDYSTKFQGNSQYDDLSLKNIKFDSFNMKEIKIIRKRIDSLLKIYKVEKIKNKKFEDRLKSMLNLGTNVPSFAGYYYQKKEKINFNKFKGKVILLDFWYMSCYPCVEAIPEINKLYNKYKDKGFIALGINSNDKFSNKKQIEKFLKYNKIDYPIIFVSHNVDSLYYVNSFPSLYLIDKRGKIIYRQKGIYVNPKNGRVNSDSLEYYIKKYL